MSDNRSRARAGEPPKVVRGRVIPMSKLKLLGLILACAGFFVVCGYLLYERWVLPANEGVLPFRLTWWGSALVGVGFLGGLTGVVGVPFHFLCPKQLILGDEALQVVHRWVSGAVVVEVHIPYANMEAVVYEKRGEDWQAGIDLYDPDDGTYAERAGDLRQRERKGRDFILDGGYTVSLQEVVRLIEKRRRKAARRREAELSDSEA